MALLGAIIVVSILVIGVLLMAWYVFPNVVCTMDLGEGLQEQGTKDPLVELCGVLRQ